MTGIQAPYVGKGEAEYEEPDGYFDAHADDGDYERDTEDYDYQHIQNYLECFDL